MIGRLAFRSLTAHPVRSAVLAGGFGVGVGVMAILLGVAAIVLEQAQAPALVGGGDVVVRLGAEVPGALVLAGALQAEGIKEQIVAAAPSHASELFLLRDGKATSVFARGGIPSREKALNDRETVSFEGWHDTAADVAWTRGTSDAVLRHVDRFHPIPNAPDWEGSWAEWLYFKGPRFYATFLVGPRTASGRRAAGVRLQLERGGRTETFSTSAELTDAQALQAPNLTIGASSVRLDGMTYRLHFDVKDASGRRALGDLTLEASPGRLVPPIDISGARGWRSGYVVPVMSGALAGTLSVGGETVSLEGAGYHDHNWGFWEGVSWQWGQVQHDDLSFVFGRVFPPPEAADPTRVPGFVGVLGPSGPIGYTTNVTIAETNDTRGQPRMVTVRARGSGIDLRLRFDVASIVTNRMQQGPLGGQLDFLQMRGHYEAAGQIGSRTIAFTASGAAETFRGASSSR